MNPWNIDDVAMNLEKAITMSVPEREARRARDIKFIQENTVGAWARRCLDDVIAARKESKASKVSLGYGFGFGFRVFGDKFNINRLDVDKLSRDYKTSSRRLLILDYGGTLVDDGSEETDKYMKTTEARVWHYDNSSKNSRDNVTTGGGGIETRTEIRSEVANVLRKLCSDGRNSVYVVSSDLRAEVMHALDGISTRLGVIAENGFVYRNAYSAPDEEWKCLVPGHDGRNRTEDADGGFCGSSDDIDDETWQELTHSLMKEYAERTNGSFVALSPSSVQFNYLLSDPELGAMQGRCMRQELEQLLVSFPVIVDSGKGFVNVFLENVNRGEAVRRILEESRGSGWGTPTAARPTWGELARVLVDVSDSTLSCAWATIRRTSRSSASFTSFVLE